MNATDEGHERDLETFATLIRPFNFSIPIEVERQFQAVHEHLRTGPHCVDHLTGEKGKKWLERLNEQLLGDVREGVAAVYFHIDQISRVESAIKESITQSPEEWFPPGTAGRGFHCRPINFEFQAFHFALRRTLEYVAGVTMKYFKSEGTSIRKLSTGIERADPRMPRIAVQQRLSAADLEAHIGSDKDRSVRDLLAHYSAVDPNLLNLTRSPSGTLVAYFPKVQKTRGADEQPEDLSALLRRELDWMLGLTFGIFNDLGLLQESWSGEAPQDADGIHGPQALKKQSS